MVMETSRPPLVTSNSDLFNDTAGPKTNASNPNLNKARNINAIIMREIVYTSIVSCIEVPMICLAIYAVNSLIKSKQAPMVFIKNLLISDLIFICSILLYNLGYMWGILDLAFITLQWTSFTGLFFMTCIAVERYILIAHPIWHRSHCSVKCLKCTSLIGWLVSLIAFPINMYSSVLIYYMSFIAYAVMIGCFVGSCRSLSHSISLTPLKKQLVIAPLFFVVISYTFLILPSTVVILLSITLNKWHENLLDFTACLYVLNPLVDCLLYVFMRSDAENIIRMPHCGSRLNRGETEMEQTTSTNVQSAHV